MTTLAKTPVSKTFYLATEWNGRKYSQSSDVPEFTPPSSLSVTPSGTTNGLSWTNGTASAQTVIYRSGTQTGTYTQIGTVNAGVTSYNDTGLANGTYWYKVAHLYNGNSSSQTTGASGTISGSTGTRTLTGSGFGGEPTVLIFDRATGTDGGAYSLTADVGSWTRYKDETDGASSDVRYLTHAGRTWMAGRAPSQVGSTAANSTGVSMEVVPKHTQYYIEWRVVIPTGFCVPGASPNTNSKTWTDTSSRWKMVWCWNTDYAATTQTDCAYATFTGGTGGGPIAIAGNAMRPRYGSTSSNSGINYSSSSFSAVNENLFGAYVSEGSAVDTFDGVFESIQANGTGVTRTVRTNARNWYGASAPLPAIGHDLFIFSAWSGNIDQTNVQHGWADMYIATGANSRARVYAHNATTLAASTQVYNVTACKSAWSGTSITVTGLASRESLPYMSVISADGTLCENVSWS